jgi:hypothetical protein
MTDHDQEKEKEREYSGDVHVLDSSNSTAERKYEGSEVVGATDKIASKVKSAIFGKPGDSVDTLPEAVRVSNNIRTVLLGLFVLIGFIVLVFAVFTASVGPDLARTAAGVFMAAIIAAIIGAFALLGIVLYPIRVENKTK